MMMKSVRHPDGIPPRGAPSLPLPPPPLLPTEVHFPNFDGLNEVMI